MRILFLSICVAGSYSTVRHLPATLHGGGCTVACRTSTPRLAFLGEPRTDSRQAKEAGLVRWLDENGVELSDQAGWGRAAHPLRIEAQTVEDFELSGRGLLARKEIVQGEMIVRIPSSLIMTRETAQQVLGPSVVSDSLGEYLCLALLLVYERAKGASSFWAPYINILPTKEEVGQSWAWEAEDMALLEGSKITDSSASLRAKIGREHATLLTEVVRPNGLDESVFSLDAFEWAMSMLLSRAIDLREVETLALVPYADLLNHSPYASSYFFYNKIAFSKDREVCLYADRAYAKNDQVLISYGQKSNAELLLLYGFVVDRNLFDEVELTISLSEEDPRYDEKKEFLRLQGLKTSMAFPLLIDRYSSELLQYLRLCCVTPADGALSSYAYNEPLSVANERAAMNALREGCQQALAGYPQAEAEDAALMENSKLFATLSRNQRMAVKLRRNEKRILLRTIRTCDSALDSL